MRIETIGNATLYLGDCLTVLPDLPRADVVITDPPYGIGDRLVKGGRNSGAYSGMIGSGAEIWDVRPTKETFDLILSKSDHQVIWGGNFFPLPPCEKPLCWDKIRPNQKNASEWEYAWTSLTGRAQLFAYCGNAGFVAKEPREHPTQKPVALMKWCLGFFPKATTVLDPYMGSGSTGVACVEMGRQFIGIEADSRYFDIACERLENAQRQERMFA